MLKQKTVGGDYELCEFYDRVKGSMVICGEDLDERRKIDEFMSFKEEVCGRGRFTMEDYVETWKADESQRVLMDWIRVRVDEGGMDLSKLSLYDIPQECRTEKLVRFMSCYVHPLNATYVFRKTGWLTSEFYMNMLNVSVIGLPYITEKALTEEMVMLNLVVGDASSKKEGGSMYCGIRFVPHMMMTREMVWFACTLHPAWFHMVDFRFLNEKFVLQLFAKSPKIYHIYMKMMQDNGTKNVKETNKGMYYLYKLCSGEESSVLEEIGQTEVERVILSAFTKNPSMKVVLPSKYHKLVEQFRFRQMMGQIWMRPPLTNEDWKMHAELLKDLIKMSKTGVVPSMGDREEIVRRLFGGSWNVLSDQVINILNKIFRNTDFLYQVSHLSHCLYSPTTEEEIDRYETVMKEWRELRDRGAKSEDVREWFVDRVYSKSQTYELCLEISSYLNCRMVELPLSANVYSVCLKLSQMNTSDTLLRRVRGMKTEGNVLEKFFVEEVVPLLGGIGGNGAYRELVLECLRRDGRLLYHLPLQDREIAEIAVRSCPEAVMYVFPEVCTRGLFERAVMARPILFFVVPRVYKTKKMCLEACRRYTWALFFVPPELMEVEGLCMIAEGNYELYWACRSQTERMGVEATEDFDCRMLDTECMRYVRCKLPLDNNRGV